MMKTTLATAPRPSPNYDDRQAEINMLVLHYTGMPTAEEALTRLCDPAAKVSAHYCIEEDGQVFALVDEAARAWHAGVSSWRGEEDINSASIGIELVNPGHEWGYRKFAEAQMVSLIALASDIIRRHRIPARHVLGHSDIAPTRREDPGELFDWKRLAHAGIGLWPAISTVSSEVLRGKQLSRFQQALANFGYDTPVTGETGAQYQAVLKAFHRHFRPDALNDEADEMSLALITALNTAASIA